MAEQDSPKNEAKQSGESKLTTFLPWIIIGVVALAASISGIALAKLLAGSKPVEVVQEPQLQKKSFEDLLSEDSPDSKSWLYQLEPVVCNLDEPGVTRYVRATVTLELSGEMDETKGRDFLDNKTLVLTDWLNVFLAGLSLEDVRGTDNLRQIKNQIRDRANELLFPNSRPFIRRVLLKEFAVQ